MFSGFLGAVPCRLASNPSSFDGGGNRKALPQRRLHQLLALTLSPLSAVSPHTPFALARTLPSLLLAHSESMHEHQDQDRWKVVAALMPYTSLLSLFV